MIRKSCAILAILLFAVCLEASAQGVLIPRLVKKLDWKNASQAKAAYNELLAKGEKAVPYLISSLSDPFENTSIRVNCADILGKLKSKEAIPALIDALNAKKIRIRYTAATALGNIGDSSALPALIRYLNDPDITVQDHVIAALRKINDKSAGPALVNMLQNPYPSIRFHAAQVLVDFGTKEAGPAFISILKGVWDSREVRQLAASGLGNIGGKEAAETLTKSLINDPEPLVRAQCAVSLGELGSKKAVPYLIKALNDEYKNVVLSSASSLSQITGRPLSYDPDAWRTWYEARAK